MSDVRVVVVDDGPRVLQVDGYAAADGAWLAWLLANFTVLVDEDGNHLRDESGAYLVDETVTEI